MVNYAINTDLTGADIKKLRKLLGMTQKEFAVLVNSSKRAVENWESDDRPIKGAISVLAGLLFQKPELVKALTVPENKLKLRLWYMYENIICTVIDVDEINRIVEIRNYTDNTLFRAFGRNTSPDYSDYEEFLESRCFPKSRDMIKTEYERLGVPFYDPILIIEKTEGRMSEDHFWIRVER